MSSNLTPSPPFSDDEKHRSPPPPVRTPIFPSREDCWSEEATRTLIGAWGSHYMELNRGNLRQKHWQSVADAVNAVHATSPKLRRTDVQCKNRVDTVKKKYKIEKSKLLQSNGRRASTWPHFQSLDSLIGDSFNNNNNNHNNNALTRNRRFSESPESSPESPIRLPERNQMPIVPWSVPVGPRSKRSVAERNFSVMAAAAAAMEAAAEEEEDRGKIVEDNDEEENEFVRRKRRKRAASSEEGRGYGRLAEAIAKLGEVYVRVEEAKQRQMVELEKQRMQFLKDLEIQRMKLLMESQVQIEKIRQNLQNKNGYV